MKNAYIFDFDGTLVDSMSLWSDMVISYLDEQGINYPSDLIRRVNTMGAVDGIRYISTLDERLNAEDMIKVFGEKTLYQYANVIGAKAGVIEFLNKIKESGAPIYMLTACNPLLLTPCSKRLGIYELFDGIYSTDDLCLDKKNPELYHRVLDMIGKLPEECLFFDDDINALKTAKSLGLKVYGVYDETSRDNESEIRSFADGYFYDFNDAI